MSKLLKKLRNIVAMFLIVSAAITATYPRRAKAFELNGQNIRTIAAVISCAVSVLTYFKGYSDGKKTYCNCNCNCNCGEK
jgi:hypothetical protein